MLNIIISQELELLLVYQVIAVNGFCFSIQIIDGFLYCYLSILLV